MAAVLDRLLVESLTEFLIVLFIHISGVIMSFIAVRRDSDIVWRDMKFERMDPEGRSSVPLLQHPRLIYVLSCGSSIHKTPETVLSE